MLLSSSSTSGDQKKTEKTSTDTVSIKQLLKTIRYQAITVLSEPNNVASITEKRLADSIELVKSMDIPPFVPENVQSDENAASISAKPVAVLDVSTKPEIRVAPLITMIDENPKLIANPLAAADVLFVKREFKYAARYYILSLSKTPKGPKAINRPWILFQLGNCLRYGNPTEAYKYYEQLIVEYPNDHFAPMAKAQQNIIAWYQQNKPEKVVEKYIGDPNSL